jgi:hypothetical protein
MNITMRFQRQLSTTCFTKDVSTVDKKMKFKTNKRILQYHIHKTTGKVVILKDIHNMASSSKGADEANLQALLKEMKKVPRCDIFVGPFGNV